MSEVKTGIKETKEVIVAVVVVKDAVTEIFKDGKVNLEDAQAVVKLAGHAKTLTDAIEGLSLVKDELKDLDNAEAKELLLALVDVIVPANA